MAAVQALVLLNALANSKHSAICVALIGCGFVDAACARFTTPEFEGRSVLHQHIFSLLKLIILHSGRIVCFCFCSVSYLFIFFSKKAMVLLIVFLVGLLLVS